MRGRIDMKGEIKNKYIEFVNHIDFPMILYVYESNKVIVMNGYAKEILGKKYEDIRDVFNGKKFRLSKEVIDGESALLKNINVTSETDSNIEIDIDINVLMLDNVHFVFMLFEESFKNMFSGIMSVHAMRVSWMYLDNDKVHMNKCLQDDLDGVGIYEYLDEFTVDKLEEIKRSVIDVGVCQYNSIQMIVKRDKSNHFIKINRMPIINSSGKNIGVLCIHNIILDKESNRKLYDNVLQGINQKKDLNNSDVIVNNDMKNKERCINLDKEVAAMKETFEKKGMPDRIKFEEDVKNYIINSIESNTNGTMIMFRLENFEHIKYNVGALYIEELIKQFEKQIMDEPLLKDSCYKSRNIEYIILLNTDEESKVDEIILLINKYFNGKRMIRDKEVDCEINIGITYFPKDGIKSTALLKNVDFAIYEAKKDKDKNYKVYEMVKRI